MAASSSSSSAAAAMKAPWVRIDNLPNQTTEQQIRDMLTQCGTVHPKWISGVFFIHPVTGEVLASKDKQGVAYVNVRNAATAALAVNRCNHYIMHGRRLELEQPDVPPNVPDVGSAAARPPPLLLLPPSAAASTASSSAAAASAATHVASFRPRRNTTVPTSASASASTSASASVLPASFTIAIRMAPLRPATTAAEVQSVLADRGIDALVGHIVIAHPPNYYRSAYLFYEQADYEVAGQVVKRCNDDIVNGEALIVKRLTIKEAADELAAVSCGGSLFTNITSVPPPPPPPPPVPAPASSSSLPSLEPAVDRQLPRAKVSASASATNTAAVSASTAPAAAAAPPAAAATEAKAKKRVHFSTDAKKKDCDCGQCDDCAFDRLGFDDPFDSSADPPAPPPKRTRKTPFPTTKLSLSVVVPSSSSSSSSSAFVGPRPRCKWPSCFKGAACLTCSGCPEHHPIGWCRETLPPLWMAPASSSASTSASTSAIRSSVFDFPEDE